MNRQRQSPLSPLILFWVSWHAFSDSNVILFLDWLLNSEGLHALQIWGCFVFGWVSVCTSYFVSFFFFCVCLYYLFLCFFCFYSWSEIEWDLLCGDSDSKTWKALVLLARKGCLVTNVLDLSFDLGLNTFVLVKPVMLVFLCSSIIWCPKSVEICRSQGVKSTFTLALASYPS